jgi:hypothetical protein
MPPPMLEMPAARWKTELLILSGLLAFGLLVLPIAVYWVGEKVIGEYASDEGLWGLLTAVWSGVAHGAPMAWILVLSPYVVVQLLRLAWALRKPPSIVNDVTVSHSDQ